MYSLNRIITDNESMYIKWKNSLISACISTLYIPVPGTLLYWCLEYLETLENLKNLS